jgi:hypothetical protein
MLCSTLCLGLGLMLGFRFRLGLGFVLRFAIAPRISSWCYDVCIGFDVVFC